MNNKNYFHQLLLSLDHVLNAMLCGYANETLSSRSWRCGYLKKAPKKRWIIAVKIIDTLFFFHDQHCKNAYIKGVKRMRLSLKARQRDAKC